MEIRKTFTIDALTSDGKVMQVGETYIFDTAAGCFVGEYLGLSKHGTLQFKGVIADTDVRFNVLPKSVIDIYETYTEIKREDSRQ